MKNKIVLIVVLIASALSGRAQNLILNPSFESPVVPTGSLLGIGIIPGAELFIDAGSPNTGITSWSVTQGTVTIIDNGSTVVGALGLLVPPDGNQFAVLNSLSISVLGVLSVGGLGTLQQTFATTPGTAYQLSFEYAGLSVSTLNGTAALNVTVSNSRSSTGPSGGLLNVSINSFQNETFDFVATGTSSTLTFDEPTGSLAHANGVGLDDINLTSLGMVAVPEFSHYGSVVAAFLGLLIAGRFLRARENLSGPGMELPVNLS